MANAHHSIKIAAKQSGLSQHVIRIWERRYGAVEPERTGTNRRLYSDGNIERLRLLREATQLGHNIGNIAKLPTAKLRELLISSQPAGEHGRGEAKGADLSSPAEALQVQALAAVRKLDSAALEQTLARGSILLGHQGLLQKLVAPLAHQVGELWRAGEITAAHEHFASAVIRVFLESSARSFAPEASAPNLVVATPSGQLHELGAVLAAAAARSVGWNVTYLGVGLPAAEIAGATLQNRSRAVALSLVYPEDDPDVAKELLSLRRMLPAEIPILIGGRAGHAYRKVLSQVRAVCLPDLDAFYPILEQLRKVRGQT